MIALPRHPNYWQSLRYYNLYRLVVALVLLVFFMRWYGGADALESSSRQLFQRSAVLHFACVVAGIWGAWRWQHRFNLQLSVQVLSDAVLLSVMMLAAGGVGSGIGFLLLISVAAASLIVHGRLALFYASLATVATLLTTLFGVSVLGFELASIVQAGLLSAAYFATAISAHFLGQRVADNEELARQRGESLQNQIRISQRVMQRMQDGVLVVGDGGLIRQHNPQAALLLQRDDLLGRSLEEIAMPLADAYASWREDATRDVADSVDLQGKATRLRFIPTESSDGAALVFLEDVGRMREQALQLKLASLGRLTASIAHEIRNPLSAISHAGELLAEGNPDEGDARLLRILRDNTLRLDRIVQDVLALGRSRQVTPERLHLADFLALFVEEFCGKESLPRERIALEVPADAVLCFEPAHLHQVLWNLLANALRHSSDEAGCIRLLVREGALAQRVEVHVIDDGPGIPSEVRRYIFEPFFTTEHKGTGLGLYIARELCELNSARLRLDASERGAHFIIFGRKDTCQQTGASGAPAAN